MDACLNPMSYLTCLVLGQLHLRRLDTNSIYEVSLSLGLSNNASYHKTEWHQTYNSIKTCLQCLSTSTCLPCSSCFQLARLNHTSLPYLESKLQSYI